MGGVYLPLNPEYTQAEIDFFLADADPRLFVCSPTDAVRYAPRDGLHVEGLAADGTGSIMQQAAAAEPAPETTHATVSTDDPAAILYTSGTTGRPKGALLTHGNLASNAAALIHSWRFTGQDRLIHALPVFHAHGLFVAVNMSVVAGASMLWLERFDTGRVIDLMKTATVLMGVPTFYTRLLDSDRLTREATARMRLFVSGSAPLLARDHRRFQERTGHAILERYGMSETLMITTNPYDGQRVPGAVGKPLPGVEIRVCDPVNGEPVPDGHNGMVEVRGPNVFAGYWRLPQKTAAEFRADGFFVTGDLGHLDNDGYLWLVGRDKDLVISGGYNVYPKEIELLIDEVPGVLESAVIGLPHPDLGEAVTAVVVPRPGAQLNEQVVTDALRDRLARYKQPRTVLFADQLPRNVMGKVQKTRLRETYADLPS